MPTPEERGSLLARDNVEANVSPQMFGQAMHLMAKALTGPPRAQQALEPAK